MDNFPDLESERLLLRKLEFNDSESIYKIFSNEKVVKYCGMYPLENVSEATDFINKFNNSFIDGEGFRWGIILKKENNLIGICGLSSIKKNHLKCEIGFELEPSYWGNGYINEAVKKIINYGFSKLCINRIEAIVYPENIPSQRTLEKLGFVQECLLRDYSVYREKKQNVYMYSILNRLERRENE